MKQNMCVICHSVNSNRIHPLIAADAGHIRLQLRLDPFGYRFRSTLMLKTKWMWFLRKAWDIDLCRPFRALLLYLRFPTAYAGGLNNFAPAGLACVCPPQSHIDKDLGKVGRDGSAAPELAAGGQVERGR